MYLTANDLAHIAFVTSSGYVIHRQSCRQRAIKRSCRLLSTGKYPAIRIGLALSSMVLIDVSPRRNISRSSVLEAALKFRIVGNGLSLPTLFDSAP